MIKTPARYPIGFKLLYEKGPCLAVSKPAGLLTQAPPGIDSLEVRIKEFIKQREGTSGNVYLGVPHRLDRPASGAMVFARNRRAARRLSEQFEGRLVQKTYWAWVAGELDGDRGTWVDFIRKVPGEARAEIVPDTHPDGKEAILRYRVMRRNARGTVLEIELQTGRTHQIRVQASARGHPLLGDGFYGSTVPFGPDFCDHRQRAIALHAHQLAFLHPMSRERVVVQAPFPNFWSLESS